MGDFSVVTCPLRYVDGTQEVEWKSLHAGIEKMEGPWFNPSLEQPFY